MRDIKGGITLVFMWVDFLKVPFCRLRKVRNLLLYLPSSANPLAFCKVQMLFASEMCEVMAGVCASDRTGLLGSAIKNTTDETLFLELALRGYDLSSLRDDQTTAEIVKIS